MRKIICKFKAKNIIENLMAFIEIEYYKNHWWYINFKGERIHRYSSIEEAKDDIIDLYGNWLDFGLLL